MYPKRAIAVFLILLFSLLSATPALVQETINKTQEGSALILTKIERDFLKKAGPIRVHNEGDWAPFNFNQNGTPRGFSVDYMKLLAQKTGLEIKFISGPSWDQFLDMVKKDKLDVMLNIAMSPERQQFLEFTPSYVTMVQMLYTRKDFPAVSTIKDLYGKRFAVPKGFFLQEALKLHPQIKIVEVSDTSAAIRAVSVGKADALFDLMPVVDYITGQLQITNLKVGGDIGMKEGKPIPLHIAVSKDKKILAGIIEKGMAGITEEELRKLHEKWLPGSARIKQDTVPPKGANAFELTEKERAFIAGKQLRLGVDVARPPFEYLNEKGVYTGISAEFIMAAAKRLGITVVPQKEMKWTEAMEKIKTGEIDVIPKVTPTPSRERFMNFTSPYATFPSVIVTRKDRLAGGLDDLRGLKVGVNKGQIVEANLKREHPELSLVAYPDIETGLRSLATGKCDAYVDNLGAVAYTIEQVGLPNLRIAASTPYTHDLAFGVRKDWPLMVSALEKALDSMTDQEKTEIRNRWLAIKYQVDIPWHLIVPIGTALFFITIFVIIWNRRLGRAIREREKSEKKVKAMGEAMGDALVMIDGAGKVLFWNRAAEKLFGYTSDEAMGRDFHDMAVPKELREKAHEGIRQFAASGQGAVFGAAIETTAVNRGGEVFPVEVNLSPFKVDEQWFAVGNVRDITERKRAEDALKESEKRVQTILNSISAGIIIIDPEDRKIVEVNPVAAQMIGLTVEEIVGHVCHQFICPREMNNCPVLDNDQKIDNAERVLITSTGRQIPILKTATPVNLGGKRYLLESFIDISEQKRAEEAIRESEERSHLILSSMQEGIWGLDSEGKTTFVNRAALDMLCYTEEEVIGKSMHDLVHHAYPDGSAYPREECHMYKTFSDGTSRNIDHEVLWRKDGSSFPVEYTTTPINKKGALSGAVITFHDITDRKHAEEELKAQMAELERFNRITINREIKMIQLKEEINTLMEQAGGVKKYKIVE